LKVGPRERGQALWLLALPFAVAFIVWLARTMAFGGRSRYALIGLAVFAVVARPIWIVVARKAGPAALNVEVPLVLLLASTLVWRTRGATALATNPLDSAAQLRIAMVAAAALLGFFAFFSPPRPEATPRERLTTLPFRLYLAYLAVVIVGIPFSVKPLLTSYRALELAVGCIVLLGAYRALGNAAARRIEATIYWFSIALLGSVWIGRFLDPARALARPTDTAVPLKWELQGVYPSMAANTVGALGALVAIWSLSRYFNPRRYGGRRWVALALTLGGVVSIIAAQYRTGYLAFTAGALVIFWLRKRSLFVVLLATAILILAWSPSLIGSAQPYVLRGQTTQEASQLSGRVDFWSAAVPVWERSPVVGRGLWTASRYEVLAPLGFDTTASVHSTWVEALVGTGVLGLGLLLASVLETLRRAWKAARASPWAPIGPLALMVMLTVRSLTGNLFESFGHEQLVFLAIVLALEDRRVRRTLVAETSTAASQHDDAALGAPAT
jgi:O-antigen ligase